MISQHYLFLDSTDIFLQRFVSMKRKWICIKIPHHSYPPSFLCFKSENILCCSTNRIHATLHLLGAFTSNQVQHAVQGMCHNDFIQHQKCLTDTNCNSNHKHGAEMCFSWRLLHIKDSLLSFCSGKVKVCKLMVRLVICHTCLPPTLSHDWCWDLPPPLSPTPLALD